MIIHRDNINEAIAEMWHEPFLALDTETTGLSVWHGDRLFFISFASEHKVWSVRIGEGRLELPREQLHLFQPLLSQFFRVWFIHNAKFDMGMLEAEGLKLNGTIWDTVTGERLAFNAHSSYSLDACAKRLGLEKLGSVEEYIKKHKLYENVPVPGKKIRKKKMFFNLVEPNLLREYAEQDVRVTYKLGTHQRFAIRDIIDELHPKLRKGELCYEIEKEVTKVCYEIEKTGIRVDKNYCERADRFESDKAKAAANRFKELTGVPLVNSAKGLSPVFTQRGFIAPKTDKENDQFDDEVLSKWGETSEEARLVLAYREAEKKANTYYKSFLFHSDVNSVLHVNLNQAGTYTGRFSSQSPNLQNLPKEEDLTPEFLVRRSFIPREGCSFFMLDYDQMEYAVMLDYAKEESLIEKVKGGLDVHQATADMVGGISRKQAKTLNFAILYGAGVAKIAAQLGCSEQEARQLKYKYYDKLPKVKTLIQEVINRARMTGFIYNRFGRKYHFEPDFSYKAPNYLIQGSCADAMKLAMVRTQDYLKDYKAKIVLQVHDELVLEVPKGEEFVVSEVRKIMEGAYPASLLPLTVGVEWSPRSLADKEEWVENQSQTSEKDS